MTSAPVEINGVPTAMTWDLGDNDDGDVVLLEIDREETDGSLGEEI